MNKLYIIYKKNKRSKLKTACNLFYYDFSISQLGENKYITFSLVLYFIINNFNHNESTTKMHHGTNKISSCCYLKRKLTCKYVHLFYI